MTDERPKNPPLFRVKICGITSPDDARFVVDCTAGSRIATSRPMIAIVTSSSTRVKPRRRRPPRHARIRAACGVASHRRPIRPVASGSDDAGSGTNAIRKSSIAIVSRFPEPVEAARAATRNQTLSWYDIAASEGGSIVKVVVPHVPGSAHVPIVVNDVGDVPRPYWIDQVFDRGSTSSIISVSEPDVSDRPRESN